MTAASEESLIGRHLPAEASADALLEGFLAYAAEAGLDLYEAQEEAILELFAGASVVLKTPTGSGKSLVASALCFKALAEKKRCFYTAPIKALVSEKFFSACRDFGADNVGMMTGDASVNRDAPIVCCTAEILANMALREMEQTPVDYVVMDEFHYYADRDRGWAWQVPLLTMPRTRFLLMSATLGDTARFEDAVEALTGEAAVTVSSDQRPVPLDFSYRVSPIHETIQELYDEGKAPLYIVHFTQRAAAEQAQALTSIDFLTREQKDAIKQATSKFRFDTPFGKDLKRWVRHGIGVHHAGLLPKYRLLIEKLAQEGLLRLICGTDTLGVGVNVPIRTVLFTKLCKYDGKRTAVLTVRDFQQIAGRAGRRGYDTEGSVVCQAPEHVVENTKMRNKAAGDAKKLRKMRSKKPPERGYAHWDEAVFQRLIESEPETLESSFNVTHGMLLSVLDRPDGDGCRRMKRLLRSTHEPKRRKFELGRLAITMFRSLIDAKVIELSDRDGQHYVDVASELQADFSLHHALSLYVVEVAPTLDRERESYAFDLISFVEATLEDPNVVLMRQLDKIKGDAIAQMKAEGIEYEERMAKLDELDIDKPNLEEILQTFEDFRARHTWVGATWIAPKSIAREMLEKCMSFREYVNEYGLARSEGVLLRYLSGAYKALVGNVPETAKDDALYDLTDELGAIVREVDSSLIDEWERLAEGEPSSDDVERAPRREKKLYEDRRAFRAMVRNAAFRLVRWLALGRFDSAAAELAPPTEGPAWTSTSLADTFAPYLEDHEALRFDPGARAPSNTQIEEGAAEWRVRQVLVDADEHNDWSLELRIDLEASHEAGRPVVRLERLGATSL